MTALASTATKIAMGRLPILLGLLLTFFPGSLRAATTPEELTAGLGAGDCARLSMLLQATTFGIDVAKVEALFGQDDAVKITEIIKKAGFSEESRKRIGEILLQAEPCVVSLRFLRDVPWDRFMNGRRKYLDRAIEAGVITAGESDTLWRQSVEDFAALRGRGVKKDDAIFYQIKRDRVRIVLFDGARNVLIDVDRAGEARVRTTRDTYFGPRSDFVRKLIESLEHGGTPEKH
jgi:hypothetical protein